MEILYFDTLPSTQRYIIEKLKKEDTELPLAVLAKEQSDGLGSRDNKWSGGRGNYFASIAVDISRLPKDLPLSSASIYFSFIMKQTLEDMGLNVWLKWPNDFYSNNDKVGGTITNKIKNTLVCGIGINLNNSQNGYRTLQSDISSEILLKEYIYRLKQYPKWKQVFSDYRVEFELSRKFSVHIENNKKSLSQAVLCSDGSLLIDKEKVYSLR